MLDDVQSMGGLLMQPGPLGQLTKLRGVNYSGKVLVETKGLNGNRWTNWLALPRSVSW